MLKKINYKQCLLYLFMVLGIVITVGFTLLEEGMPGDLKDMIYHMLRIESVMEALQAGEYPAHVNPIFFGGYGYGSSVFYPDLFLIIPAFMRMIGFSPLMTWKLNILLVTVVCSAATYFSFKYIVKNNYFAMGGTFLLVLSQFYVADIMQRSGLSEYTACIFMPILIAGLYDFVACEGKKVYLIGIAFVGMLLSHMIMTVVGLLITVMFFLIMLCVPSKRKNILKREKLVNLAVAALLSVLAVSYYVFPMIEQMLNDEFFYMEPWARIGDYTQPFGAFFNSTGEFYFVAYIGVGIPILMLLGSRMLFGKPQNRWADFFLFGGITLLVSTTDIVPWDLFNDTFLNVLQFTYRLYPYALCFIVLGLMLYLKEKCSDNIKQAIIFIVVISVGFGAWQNRVSHNEERFPINISYLYENSFSVGRGEWLPKGVTNEVRTVNATMNVVGSTGEVEFMREGYNEYSFACRAEKTEYYILPLIYYKGYTAQLIQGGETTELAVTRTTDGLVEVCVPEGGQGTVRVQYAGTAIQFVSNIVSLVTVIAIAVFAIWRKRKGFLFPWENKLQIKG